MEDYRDEDYVIEVSKRLKAEGELQMSDVADIFDLLCFEDYEGVETYLDNEPEWANERDHSGNTPLMIAARDLDYDMFALLLPYSDHRAVNNSGWDAVMIASDSLLNSQDTYFSARLGNMLDAVAWKNREEMEAK